VGYSFEPSWKPEVDDVGCSFSIVEALVFFEDFEFPQECDEVLGGAVVVFRFNK